MQHLTWSAAVALCKQSGNPWAMATIISTQGSTPRNSGTKMIITADAIYDTVGGGQLEFAIIQHARNLINANVDRQQLQHIPLSAKVNQCCGGSVTVLLECFAAASLNITVFGAGHVAKALITILGQLDARIVWLDNRPEEFPKHLPLNTQAVPYHDPVAQVATMNPNSYAVVLTHQHALDYEILEALLDRKDCAYIGVIGSNTKAMRFKKRLQSAAFSAAEIASIHCPIGLAQVPGKQPMEVAVSIAGQVIQHHHLRSPAHEQGTNSKKNSGLAWQEMQQVLNNTTTDPVEIIKR